MTAIITDFLVLIGGNFAAQALVEPHMFKVSFFVGLALAGVCWYGCSRFGWLWNKRYRFRLGHHVLCGLAAVITLLACVVYPPLRFTKNAAEISVTLWEQTLLLNKTWVDTTFDKAYHRLKAQGLLDPHAFPLGSRKIPAETEKQITTTSSVYAESATADFALRRPFLNLLVRANIEVPETAMAEDMRKWFAARSGEPYPTERGAKLVVQQIKKGLDGQIPRVVTFSRAVCIALFLLFQLIPFTLIGWAAYRDIKVVT